jgi:hypothetical protein
MIYRFPNPLAGPTPLLCPGDVLEPDKVLGILLKKLSQLSRPPDLPASVLVRFRKWNFP